MKIHDISKELFSTPVFPGHPAPKAEHLKRIAHGDNCNLSGFYTGCHCSTHLDAPTHFVEGGETIDQIPLNRFMGKCTVVTVDGIITGEQIESLLPKLEKIVILHGNGKAYLSKSAAFVLADAEFTLVGTDALAIGAPGDEQAPHYELLSAGIPILESIDLTEITDGVYTLIAMPLKLGGLEASPCRAVLIEE